MNTMYKARVCPDIHYDLGSRASSLGTEKDRNMISTMIEESTSPIIKRLWKHWRMFLVLIIPISAMLLLTSVTLHRASNTLASTSLAIDSIDESFKFKRLIQFLQQERGISTSYLSATNMSSDIILNEFEVLQTQTDRNARSVKWPLGGILIVGYSWTLTDILTSLSAHRLRVENRTVTILSNLDYYTNLTTSLMKYITQSVITPNDRKVQRLFVASIALLSWTDDEGIKRALGTTFFSNCGWSSNDLENYYMSLHGRTSAFFDTASYYNENIENKYSILKQMVGGLRIFIDMRNTYQLFKEYESLCPFMTQVEKENKTNEWFYNMTLHIDMNFDIRQETNQEIKTQLQSLYTNAEVEFALFLSTLIVVFIISCFLCIWYMYYIATLTRNLSKYANKLKGKGEELTKEKKKTDNLLYQMLPRKIVNDLKMGRPTPAEHFEQVTIYFSDIIDFTTLGASSEPMEIVNMLNDLYCLFDECIDRYDVYKVETIGDAYMVASGVPTPNGSDHVAEIAMMALRIQNEVTYYKIPHMPGKQLQIRMGIHTGSCVAGVVGNKMPRYCLFGDTVNTSSRMESSSIGGKIHISEDTNAILIEHGNFLTEFRGIMDIKGKGQMTTYWLYKMKVEKGDAMVMLHV